jgi:predicted dehydrogenase
MSVPSVLVIGAGMYVCGRGTTGLGTILPTLIQAQADGDIGEISVAATSAESVRGLREKLAEINRRLETKATVRAYPERGSDPTAYRAALAEIPKPACVIVAVPDHLHANLALEAIEAGLHVLVVKPLTTTLTEAGTLTDRAQAKDVYGAVEFHKRLDEANLLLRQAIADGRLGELRHISVEYGQRNMIQQAFASWRQHTNIFQYLGVHYADLIYFLTGARPVRVLAVGEPKEALPTEPWTCDAIHALIEWKNGTAEFASSILTNWLEPNRASACSGANS